MSRLRTINQCLNYIKELDKDSAVTLFFIRTICSKNVIRTTTAGNKILVDLDSLIDYLNLKAC